MKMPLLKVVASVLILMSIVSAFSLFVNGQDQMHSVMVIHDANMYEYASLESPIVRKLHSGEILTLVEMMGENWIRVYKDSQSGYIPIGNLASTPEPIPEITREELSETTTSTVVEVSFEPVREFIMDGVAESTPEPYTSTEAPTDTEVVSDNLPEFSSPFAVTTANLHIRKEASKDSESLVVMPEGSLVIILNSSSPGWLYVSYNQYVGYASTEYLVEYFEDIGNSVPIATFSTQFRTSGSNSGRAFNIYKAANLLTGSAIKPGETFSLLSKIAPITAAAGYQEAPEYRVVNGIPETVSGYGGGVCQVSSTLYNVILLAQEKIDIEVVERHEHALPVSYVEQGKDATISYSSGKDFRFRNESEYTISIRCYTNQGIIGVTLLLEE